MEKILYDPDFERLNHNIPSPIVKESPFLVRHPDAFKRLIVLRTYSVKISFSAVAKISGLAATRFSTPPLIGIFTFNG